MALGLQEGDGAAATATMRGERPSTRGGGKTGMPRDLPIGNGRLLINFDRSYQLRDLYYPHVGKENHTSGHAFRLGFWAEGQLRWIDDPGWERSLLFDPETGATDVQLHHADLGLRIRATDVVDYEVDLYLKRLVIANERADERQRRPFFYP